MTGRTDPPDRLTEIEGLLAEYTSDDNDYTNNCPGCREYRFNEFWEMRDAVCWLVAELRAGREGIQALESLHRRCEADRANDAQLIGQLTTRGARAESELAAAHQIIQAARELADEAREHIAVPDRYPLSNADEALAGLDRELAAFDANHPAQGEPS